MRRPTYVHSHLTRPSPQITKTRNCRYLRAQEELGEQTVVLKCSARVGMRLQPVLTPENIIFYSKTVSLYKTCW